MNKEENTEEEDHGEVIIEEENRDKKVIINNNLKKEEYIEDIDQEEIEEVIEEIEEEGTKHLIRKGSFRKQIEEEGFIEEEEGDSLGNKLINHLYFNLLLQEGCLHLSYKIHWNNKTIHHNSFLVKIQIMEKHLYLVYEKGQIL